MKEEVPPVLQYQILQLALDLPASKFSWFRIQVNRANVSLFYLLLLTYFSLFIIQTEAFYAFFS